MIIKAKRLYSEFVYTRMAAVVRDHCASALSRATERNQEACAKGDSEAFWT